MRPLKTAQGRVIYRKRNTGDGVALLKTKIIPAFSTSKSRSLVLGLKHPNGRYALP